MAEISDEIVRKAAAAAFNYDYGDGEWEREEQPRKDLECDCMRAALSAVVEDLVRGERESCALIAEHFTNAGPDDIAEHPMIGAFQREIAAAIRARPTKETGDE